MSLLVSGAMSVFKSYTFSTQGLGAGVILYEAGFYEAPLADANLSQASATVNYNSANRASGAHAFLVAGGPGSVDAGSCSIIVSGTSVDDDGNLTVGDSETIVTDITAMATDTYYETAKKWVGQITYTLTPNGATVYSADFNYGFAKYEDFGNVNFKITQIEAVGYAGANEADFDVELIHHKDTGWTYSLAAFVPGPAAIAKLSTDYAANDQLTANAHFAWKRSNLSTNVNGRMSEGVIVRMTTTANNAIEYCNVHLGVKYL